MYLPAHFRVSDPAILHDFIEQNSFGLLISQGEGTGAGDGMISAGGEPFASHLPLLLDRAAGTHGSLVGHMARANPQWRQADGRTVLAVFSGPHVYVSPAWYEADNVVPTWNYVAVHVYGKLRITEDRDELVAIVRQYVEFYERPRPQPWSLPDRSGFVEQLVAQIVGFRVEIERIEGKFKLSQNHPPQRQQKVVDALGRRTDEASLAIAALMRDNLRQTREDKGR